MSFLQPIVDRIDPACRDIADDRQLMKELADKVGRSEILNKIEAYYGISYIDLGTVTIGNDILESFDLDQWQNIGVLPYRINEGVCYFAIPDIGNQDLKERLSLFCKQSGLTMHTAFALPHEIQDKFATLQTASVDTDINITSWVDELFSKGVDVQASDIHIEPQEHGLQIRYRIDGLLSIKDEYGLPKDIIHKIVSRIKIMAGMDIAEKRRPQDGRIADFTFNEKQYEMRVSSTPVLHGEKLVLRIFDRQQTVATFRELGFLEQEQEKLRTMLTGNHGIVFLSGATGVGKTTTLYAMVQSINTDSINICTIEDPIEKVVKNVNQIPVNTQAGVTFASVLRALLRQDPDVIVVGETRDRETAELALRAALTGHLVLTTIHANRALETLDRLYNIGIEPFLLAGSISGIISQRLVRMLCPYCKVEHALSAYEKEWLSSQQKKWPGAFDSGIVYGPKGCIHCNQIGYRGRTVVSEILMIDEAIRESIAGKQRSEQIFEEVCKRGFTPIEANGWRNVLAGKTSLAEIIRLI